MPARLLANSFTTITATDGLWDSFSLFWGRRAARSAPLTERLLGAVQGLLRHMMGRSWRRTRGEAASDGRVATEISQVLRLMHDAPEPWAPLSLHNLCAAPTVSGCATGTAPYGLPRPHRCPQRLRLCMLRERWKDLSR